jgi:hypothetical protein
MIAGWMQWLMPVSNFTSKVYPIEIMRTNLNFGAGNAA